MVESLQLSGYWKADEDTIVEISKDKIIWAPGYISELNAESKTKFTTVNHKGKVLSGTICNGEIWWSDGDVWSLYSRPPGNQPKDTPQAEVY